MAKQPFNPDLEDDPRLAAAMVATIEQPLLVLGDDLTVLRANPAFHRLFKVPADQVIGRQLCDIGDGQWDIPELRKLLDTVIPQKGQVEDYRVEHDFPGIGRRSMRLNASRIEGDEERLSLILLAISDVTELEKIRFELEGQREYAGKLVDSVREALVILGRDLRVKHANEPFYNTFKMDPAATEGRLIYELGNGEWDIPALRHLLENVLPKEESFDDFEVEHEFEGVGRRIMILNARRIDHLDLILLAIEDITERTQRQRRQQMLAHELSHRVKNVLTLVDALASRTAATVHSLDEFRETFHGRLQALARSHGQWLSEESTTADLRELIVETAVNCGADIERLHVQGEPVHLGSTQTVPLNLTVHELCTNAIKYGALSGSDGRVDVSWTVEKSGAARQLRFRWKESGGPEIAAPEEMGFGVELIEGFCPFELDGEAKVRFEPSGIECDLVFALG